MVSRHVGSPVQPPPENPENVEDALGVAVSCSCTPWSTVIPQFPGQERPAGLDETVPPPEPAIDTESVRRAVNVAVTVRASLKVMVHDPVPVQPPPENPVKTDVGSANACRVTCVPSRKPALHVAPQSIHGYETTEPEPEPGFETVSVHFGTKVAVTVLA